MTTTPDPKIVRDFARRAILSAAEEVDFIGIGEQFGDDENWPAEEAAYDAMHEAVNAEWKKATVTVSWPDEQPQDERDGDVRVIAELLGWVRRDYERDRMRDGAIGFSKLAAFELHFADRIAALEARDAKAGEQR